MTSFTPLTMTAFVLCVIALVMLAKKCVRNAGTQKAKLRNSSYDEIMVTINSPIDEVEKEINSAIEKMGQKTTVRHLATVICAQTNELQRLSEIVDECADAMNLIRKAHTKANISLAKHKEFEIDEEEESEGETQ